MRGDSLCLSANTVMAIFTVCVQYLYILDHLVYNLDIFFYIIFNNVHDLFFRL